MQSAPMLRTFARRKLTLLPVLVVGKSILIIAQAHYFLLSSCTWSSGVCKWNTEDGCLSRTTESDCGTTRSVKNVRSYPTDLISHPRCKWEGGTCTWNRDAQNNVCLQPPTGHTTLPDATRNCADILKGRCPLSWEVNVFGN